jgi:hypothetical protein
MIWKEMFYCLPVFLGPPRHYSFTFAFTPDHPGKALFMKEREKLLNSGCLGWEAGTATCTMIVCVLCAFKASPEK